MTITTRKATLEDRVFLWQLKVASLREYVENIYGWDDAVQKTFFENSFHPEAIRIIQLEDQDVGMVELRQREDHYFLARIEILPEFQRRGIGSTIIKRIAAGVRSSGKPLRLQVFKINPAQRLYTRLGFIMTGETETHYYMELPDLSQNPESD
jgi:ribosomal protein S18 acetylase RimI-like enzyme